MNRLAIIGAAVALVVGLSTPARGIDYVQIGSYQQCLVVPKRDARTLAKQLGVDGAGRTVAFIACFPGPDFVQAIAQPGSAYQPNLYFAVSKRGEVLCTTEVVVDLSTEAAFIVDDSCGFYNE
jgi:hypothetical protein